MKRILALLILGLSTLLMTSAPAFTAAEVEIVGQVKRVMNDVYGTPTGGKRTRKFPRYDITFGEHIQTSGSAAALIRMEDKTELYLGERAELTIDEFVYDPKTGTADAVYAFNIGALRFISGGASEGQVSIVTPTALIGIRGSEALIFVTPEQETIINVFEGRFSVRSRDGRDREPVTLTKNHNVSVSKGGAVSKVTEGVAVPPDSTDQQGKLTRYKADLSIVKEGGRLEKSRSDKISGDYSDHHDGHPEGDEPDSGH